MRRRRKQWRKTTPECGTSWNAVEGETGGKIGRGTNHGDRGMLDVGLAEPTDREAWSHRGNQESLEPRVECDHGEERR